MDYNLHVFTDGLKLIEHLKVYTVSKTVFYKKNRTLLKICNFFDTEQSKRPFSKITKNKKR